MKSMLTVPVNSAITWPIHFRPGAQLQFSMATGSWATPHETVQLSVDVRLEGKWSTIWTTKQKGEHLYRLSSWSTVKVPLGQLTGHGALRVRAESPFGAQAYKNVVLLAEPVIQSPSKGLYKDTSIAYADNILLILVDGLRADTVGPRRSQSNDTPPLPSLETLASNGVSFSNAFSATNLSRASTLALLSSQTPRFGGFHNVKWIYPRIQKRAFYQTNHALLPNVLRHQGYQTAAFGHNRYLIGNIKRSLDVGFGTVVDYRANHPLDESWAVSKAIQWMQTHRNERWFMMVHLYAPPEPATWRASRSPSDSDGGLYEQPRTYTKGLQRSDRHIAQVLQELKALKLTSKTLVVVTGTHGRVLNPAHDCWNYNSETACLDRNGHTLFDEEVHVPLIVSQPGRLPSGTHIHSAVSHLDIGPTVANLVGLSPVPGQLGRNLAFTLLKGAEPPAVPILLDGRRASAMRWRGFKLIHHERREVMVFNRKTLFQRSTSPYELYDLVRDPSELHNLALRPEQHRMLPVLRRHSDAVRNILKERKERPPRTGPLAQDLAKGILQTKNKRKTVSANTRTGAILSPSARPEMESTLLRRSPETTRSPQWHHVLFHRGNSGGQFSGQIRCHGGIEALEILGNAENNRSLLRDKENITISASSNGSETVGIRFKTNSARYSLRFNLSLDGEPIQSDRFFVGSYGVKLYSDPLIIQTTEQQSLSLSSNGGPHRRSGKLGGVFYWTERSGR